jgi:hypothetical protein
MDKDRRGIPFSFSYGARARSNPELHGWAKGAVPAVRWSHYSRTVGGGVALFDRGDTGQEINTTAPIIHL